MRPHAVPLPLCATSAALLSMACMPLRSVPPQQLHTPAVEWSSFLLAADTLPVVQSGRAGWPITTSDPMVYADAEGYHLFYSTFFCQSGQGYAYSWDPANPASCNIMTTVSSIGYAFSGDGGRNWEFRRAPVVMPADTGFDSGKIETASVFRLGDTLYIAYSADGDHGGRKLPARFQIGVARLSLGARSVRTALMDESVQFQKNPRPLLPYDVSRGSFQNNVQEPSIIVRPDSVILYYIGLGLEQPTEPIDAAGQGILSVGLGRAVFDTRLNLASRSASALLSGVNITEVRYFGEAYHLFATTLAGGEAHQGEAISYARSTDGLRWPTPRVILAPGPKPGFNDWAVLGPTAVFGNSGLVVFYTALGTTTGPCVLLGPEGRFGIPIAGNSRCMFATIARAVPHPQP